jgi:hypothetical protein
MLDDSDMDLMSSGLMVISAAAGILALFFYAKDPRCLWRNRKTIEWKGKSFEAGEVAERLAQVRRDYAGALHSRPPAQFHASLIQRATATIRGYSYWRHASVTEPTEDRQDLAPKSPRP